MDGLQAFQLGQAALDRGQVDVAIRRLRHASKTLDDPSGALFLLGVALRDAGPSVAYEAVDVLRRSAALAPNQPDVHWVLADALAECQYTQSAARSLWRAMQLEPTRVETYSTLARLAANEPSSASASQLARRAFRAALRLAPRHYETVHNVGEWLSTLGEPRRAALAYSRAVRSEPSSAPSHIALGESLQRLCLMDEARAMYRRAATLAPRSAKAQIHALLGGIGPPHATRAPAHTRWLRNSDGVPEVWPRRAGREARWEEIAAMRAAGLLGDDAPRCDLRCSLPAAARAALERLRCGRLARACTQRHRLLLGSTGTAFGPSHPGSTLICLALVVLTLGPWLGVPWYPPAHRPFGPSDVSWALSPAFGLASAKCMLFAWCYLPALTGRYAVWDGDVRAAMVAAQTRTAEALGLGAGGDAPAGGGKAML